MFDLSWRMVALLTIRDSNLPMSTARYALRLITSLHSRCSLLRVAAVVSILVLLSGACQKKQEEKAAPISEAFSAEKEAFFNSIKNPEEVSVALLPGLTNFNKNILHAPQDFHRYASNDVKAAANLGIYLADLHYCILFQEREIGKEYLTSAIELSKVILLNKTVISFLLQRYERNLSQNDSLRAVMKHLLAESTKGLQGSIHERLAGIAMASYQLENLYLALATLENFPTSLNEEQQKSKALLVQFVSEQQRRMEIVYNFIKAHSDPLDPENNPNYPFYDNALREILYAYQQSSSEDPKISELRIAISALREKMISVE